MKKPRDCRCGFTLVELLVVIAIISIIAGLVVKGLPGIWDRAHKVQCTNNLKGIHHAAFLYAQRTRKIPFASGSSSRPRAHESLNVLLASQEGKDLESETFVCPAGEATAALLDDGTTFALEGESEFRLEEQNLSYTWPDRKQGMSKKYFLCSDKYFDDHEDGDGVHCGHRGCLLAVDSTGQIREVETHHPGLTDDGRLPGLVR